MTPLAAAPSCSSLRNLKLTFRTTVYRLSRLVYVPFFSFLEFRLLPGHVPAHELAASMLNKGCCILCILHFF